MSESEPVLTLCKILWISEKHSFKVEMFGTPICSTSCSTKGGREPHFFAFLGKIKNPDFRWKSGFYIVLLFFAVVPPGIEPGTQGFSVLCSTNWAMAPSCLRVQRYDKFFTCANISIKIFKNFSVLFFCHIFATSKVTECSAVGSALRSGRRGRAFESPHSDTRRQTSIFGCRFFFFIFVIAWK